MTAVLERTSTPAAAPAPTAQRFPLDSVRALAATSVIAYHAYQNNALATGYPWTGWANALISSTDLAVDLFFVISGFLLWLPVSRSLLAGQAQRSGADMVRRRAWRLLPMYVLVLVAAWSVVNPVLPGHWVDLLLHLTMTQVYSDQYIFWTVGPAWTLAVEFHAFVLVGVLMPVLSRWGRHLHTRGARLVGASAVPVVLVLVGSAWLLWHVLIARTPGDAWSVWFGPVSKAHLFGAGMLLGVACAAGVRLTRPARLALGWGGAAVVLVCVGLRNDMGELRVQLLHLVFAVVCAAWTGVIVLSDRSPARWLTWRPLVTVGTISYSLYLVHELVMHTLRDLGVLPFMGTTGGVLVTAAATFTVSLLVARLVYGAVETPLQRAVSGWTDRRDRYADVGSEPAARS